MLRTCCARAGKGVVLKQRRPITTLVELLLPAVLVAAVVGLYVFSAPRVEGYAAPSLHSHRPIHSPTPTVPSKSGRACVEGLRRRPRTNRCDDDANAVISPSACHSVPTPPLSPSPSAQLLHLQGGEGQSTSRSRCAPRANLAAPAEPFPASPLTNPRPPPLSLRPPPPLAPLRPLLHAFHAGRRDCSSPCPPRCLPRARSASALRPPGWVGGGCVLAWLGGCGAHGVENCFRLRLASSLPHVSQTLLAQAENYVLTNTGTVPPLGT
jgi:hypothetical protein